MARLPTVGGDTGTWGTVLNDYLTESASSAALATSPGAGATSFDLAVVPTWLKIGSFIAIDAYTSQCEVRQVTGLSSNTVTVAALTYAHASGDAVEHVNGPISVLLFDAKMDGSTDDAAAIQAAIDAAWGQGGGVVLIPGRGSGTSNGGTAVADNVIINTTLNMRSGVWLKGLGATTVLKGTADPMITASSSADQDRMKISDMLLQDPDGTGIFITQSGAHQLGWTRITVENVTVADPASHGIRTAAVESRLIDCVVMRAGGHGFWIGGSDNLVMGCTAAEGTSASFSGFNFDGGNHKLSCCKAYGNEGCGFYLAGAGRHVLAGCEAQDNAIYGFRLESYSNTLSGCLADTDNLHGVHIVGNDNSVSGSFVRGGGGTGQLTRAAVYFQTTALRNVVVGTTIDLVDVPVGGKAEGNSVYMRAMPSSRKEIAFTSTWTPNPYSAEVQAMTLTGAVTLVNPILKHVGQTLTLEFRQDGTGGRTVTFPNQFRTSWTPDTAANRLNIISFLYDGTAWQQTSAVTGLTAYPGSGRADTFNRVDENLNVSSSGHTWSTFTSGTFQVVTNTCRITNPGVTNIAVLDAGVADYTVQVKVTDWVNAAGLIWRFTDSSNYYIWSGTNTLYKVVAGTPVVGWGGGGNVNDGDTIAVRTSGANHFVYVNGVLIETFVDVFNITATKAGICMGGSDILDDFVIT